MRFRNLISRLGKDKIVLLSTHIVSDVEYIASTILMMKDGQIIHKGSLEEIISAIEGKVFECLVDSQTAANIIASYPIINIREESDKTFLRLVAEKPPSETAVVAPPVLEDLYFYYFNEGANKNE